MRIVQTNGAKVVPRAFNRKAAIKILACLGSASEMLFVAYLGLEIGSRSEAMRYAEHNGDGQRGV